MNRPAVKLPISGRGSVPTHARHDVQERQAEILCGGTQGSLVPRQCELRKEIQISGANASQLLQDCRSVWAARTVDQHGFVVRARLGGDLALARRNHHTHGVIPGMDLGQR